MEDCQVANSSGHNPRSHIREYAISPDELNRNTRLVNAIKRLPTGHQVTTDALSHLAASDFHDASFSDAAITSQLDIKPTPVQNELFEGGEAEGLGEEPEDEPQVG